MRKFAVIILFSVFVITLIFVFTVYGTQADVTYDFIKNARNADWICVDSKGAENNIKFATHSDSGGMVIPNTALILENGESYSQELAMKLPVSGNYSYPVGIIGYYNHITIPSNATLRVEFGFPQDEPSNEVTARMSFFDEDDTWSCLFYNGIKYKNGELENVIFDLSHYAGKTGTFKLETWSGSASSVSYVTAVIETNPPTVGGEILPASSTISACFYTGSSDYYLNDQSQSMDAAPIVVPPGRILLPVRYVADPLGAQVEWDANERKVTIELNENTIELWIDKNTARINGIYTPIDPGNPGITPLVQPPGRTMLPLRFIAEQLGCQVDWDQGKQMVTVTYAK
jgi:hypothetical protein